MSPRALLERSFPAPEASSYTLNATFPCRSLASWRSSRNSGRECKNPAIISKPTGVPRKVGKKACPTAGLAHTEAPSIWATVLPVPASMPHRWTKKGRQPRGFTSTEAKEAASTTRAVRL